MANLKRLLKVLCAIGLIVLLARMVDWESLPHQFEGVSAPFAIAGFIGLSIQFLTSTWKWRHAMRIHLLDGEFWPLARIYGTGFFMNNFLPSAIGGDAYRVISTMPTNGARSRAISAVLVERIVGFAALLALGCLGALFLLERSALARVFLIINLAGAVTGGIVIGAIAAGWFRGLLAKIEQTKVGQAIAQNATLLRAAGPKWLALIASSFMFQVIAIAIIYLLFRSLHVEVPLASCALIAAVSGLASVLPISINGIGVIEGSFAGTAVAVGVDYEVALAVALMIRILVLPATVLFGAMYVFSREQTPAAKGVSAP